MQPVAQVEALVGRGLAGDAHNKERGARQVLLTDVETLEGFGLPPGIIKENITTRGLPINRLPAGQRLQIGATVILQLTGVCEPCHRMDEIRPGLQAALEGQRGMLARVIQGGPIRQHDPIRLLPAEDGP
jgi:MOSC domain-containing protein YiiM